MAYDRYLISAFKSGLDNSMQPWLTPDESQDSILDGFVYRGEWCKRPGYNQMAIGQINGLPYCESRMVRHVSGVSTSPAPDGAVNTFTFTAAHTPLRRGTTTVSGNNPVQSLTDNGNGYFTDAAKNINAITKANPPSVTTTVNHGYTTGQKVIIDGVVGMSQINSQLPYTITVTGLTTFTLNGANSTAYDSYASGGTSKRVQGTIGYNTGAVSVSFVTVPVNLSTVTAVYDWHPGYPVMMVANFVTATNIKELILCDTRGVNRYDPTTNRLVDISPGYAFTGDDSNFFSWTNYTSPDGTQRLLFVNNIDAIQQYDGSTVSPFYAYTATAPYTGEVYGAGLAVTLTYTHTAAHIPVLRKSVHIKNTTDGFTDISDDGFGVLSGTGSGGNKVTGTINYTTGAMSITYTVNPTIGAAMTVDYVASSAALTTCLHLFDFKDRLVLLRPTDPVGTVNGRRVQISGTGVYGDTFTVQAPGAGVIDIPDNAWIYAAAFNRDDLIIFTENSTWIMKYTSNDVVPFALDKLDESRGSGAPYSGITYLNRTTTASPRGFIGSDGYRVDRTDNKIPRYSFNEIDQKRFTQAFVGSVDEDRDHYLIHPSPGETVSDRILIQNYEEDNYSVYRLPLSCMGPYIEAQDYDWNDLLSFPDWDTMAAHFEDWNSFSYTKGLPFAVGGGHNGEVFRLNVDGVEDNPSTIRNITVISDSLLEVTTDFQDWKVGDYIYITGINGMTAANDKQGAITEIITDNYTFQINVPTDRFGTYTYGGQAMRVIPFESTTKKFNPFVQQAAKLRCGYLYFYVDSSTVGMTRNVDVQNITATNPVVVQAINHQFQVGDPVTIWQAGGMLQINGKEVQITAVSANGNEFTMNLDGSAFSAYTGGGVAAGPERCLIDVDVIVNDVPENTQVENSSAITYPKPYRVDCTPSRRDTGTKRWVKIYPNQVGRFLQFRVSNTQALSKIKIQAIMMGVGATGRLI